MKRFIGLCIMLCITITAGNALAYSVALSPVSQTIGTGKTASVDVNLAVADREALFGFNFGLAFDPGILEFKSLYFNPDVSGYLTGFTPPSAGYPDLVTFDGALDLFDGIPLGSGIFTLATVKFEGIQPGTSALDLNGDVLDFAPDAGLVPLSASASVTAAAVPEPGLVVLLGLGLAGLAGFGGRVRT